MASEFNVASGGLAAAVMRPADVSRALGVSKVSVWRWTRAGKFPKPIRLGEHSVGWLQSDIAAWLEQRRLQARGGSHE
jgi:prophage regulatory protein